MESNLSDIDLSLLKKLSNPGVFSDELISYYLHSVGCKTAHPTVLRFISQIAHLGIHKVLVEANYIVSSSTNAEFNSNDKQDGSVVTDLDYQHLAEAFQALDPSFRNLNLFLEPPL